MFRRNDRTPYSVVISARGEWHRPLAPQLRARRFARDMLRVLYLIKLDLKQQIFGLSFGRLWHLMEPALQAGTYYFLLSVVFNLNGSDSTFASFLVAIIYWRSHAALAVAAPSFLATKGHQYIEQGFGLDMAILEFAAQEVVLFLVRFAVLLMFLMFAGFAPQWDWLWGLYVALAMFAFSIGLSTWLAIAGVLFKDIGKFVGHFVWLWWYLSPGLYSFGRIPDWAKPVFLLNPFTYLIPGSHAALLKGNFNEDNAYSITVILLLSIVLMMAGWRALKRFGYVIAKYV